MDNPLVQALSKRKAAASNPEADSQSLLQEILLHVKRVADHFTGEGEDPEETVENEQNADAPAVTTQESHTP